MERRKRDENMFNVGVIWGDVLYYIILCPSYNIEKKEKGRKKKIKRGMKRKWRQRLRWMSGGNLSPLVAAIGGSLGEENGQNNYWERGNIEKRKLNIYLLVAIIKLWMGKYLQDYLGLFFKFYKIIRLWPRKIIRWECSIGNIIKKKNWKFLLSIF